MNELQKYDEQTMVSRFGGEDSFRFLMQRQAEIYQIPQVDLSRPDVRGALMKATQMSVAYGAMPGVHIYLIPFRKRDGNSWYDTYAVADSYHWRKESADAKADAKGWRYLVQFEKMTSDDVKEYVTIHAMAGPYHKEDVGYRARVLLAHEKQLADEFGIAYDPPWHYGFWRKNAAEKDEYVNNTKTGKKIWVADNIPTQRTSEWVAMKRAEKSALAQHFDLQPIRGWERRSEAAKFTALADHVTNALPEPESELDTKLLIDQRKDEEEYFAWREDEPVVKTTDDEFKWPTDEEAITFCAEFAEGVTGSVASTLEALRGLHANSKEAMLERSYSVLATALNTEFGTNAAPCVLTAICGRVVNADNPPGQDLDALVIVLEGETSTTRYRQLAELIEALKAAIVG